MTSKSQRKKPLNIRPSSKQKRFINERAPMVAMRVEYSDHGVWERGDKWYAIKIPHINPNVVCILPICLLKEDEQKFAAAKGLLIFGNGTNLTDSKVSETWPKKWRYLNKTLRHELFRKGFRLKRRQYLMLSSLPIEDVGSHAYLETNISALLDAWLEIVFHEFALEWEIERFKEDYPLELIPSKLDKPQFISIFVAKAWIILLNTLHHIDAMWECLMRQVLPLYIRGNALEKSKDNDWSKLDKYIRTKINQQQEEFYNLLREANDDWVNHSKTKGDNLLKKLRDTASHSISPRPHGVFPPTNPPIGLPDEIETFYELIEVERSRLYEAILIMCGLILHKTPINEILK